MLPSWNDIIVAGLGYVGGSTLPAAATHLGTAQVLIQLNKHVLLPAVELGVKGIYGVLGEDPLKTEQELMYARSTYFEPAFTFLDNITDGAKNLVEKAIGVDVDRDGYVGQKETPNENIDTPSIAAQESLGKNKGSGVIKISDADQVLTKEPVNLMLSIKNKKKDGMNRTTDVTSKEKQQI